MVQKNLQAPAEITYRFLRSKDTHEENGILYITLFYRLTREFSEVIGNAIHTKVETVCVNIEELRHEYADQKLQATSNEMHQYTISKEMFLELYSLSMKDERELYLLSPLYQSVQRRRLNP